MADQEEDIKRVDNKELDLETTIIGEDLEEKEDLTTLFAVRTTINQESNILKQIFYRFKILDVIPDIRAMLVSPLLPGYVFFWRYTAAKFTLGSKFAFILIISMILDVWQ